MSDVFGLPVTNGVKLSMANLIVIRRAPELHYIHVQRASASRVAQLQHLSSSAVYNLAK